MIREIKLMDGKFADGSFLFTLNKDIFTVRHLIHTIHPL